MSPTGFTDVLNRLDYIGEMCRILNDGSKFLKSGVVTLFDRTLKIEAELHQHLNRIFGE